MQDIRLITGEYQNRLAADFLGAVFPISADALKKFRTRKAASWSLPRSLPKARMNEFPKLVGG
jgi:hypothetical protein